MSYTIVTDSSCNLPESLIDELELEVLPLVFMTDGKEYQSYLKGQVTDLKERYSPLPFQTYRMHKNSSKKSSNKEMVFSISDSLVGYLELTKEFET